MRRLSRLPLRKPGSLTAVILLVNLRDAKTVYPDADGAKAKLSGNTNRGCEDFGNIGNATPDMSCAIVCRVVFKGVPDVPQQ